MADYSNCANGGKSRFGSGFRRWTSSNDTQPDLWDNSNLFTRPNTHQDHMCRPVIIGSDGSVRPVILECPPKHRHKQSTTVVEENAHRVQHASPPMKDYPRTRYDPEPALKTEGGWARPNPNGWNLRPDAQLGKVVNNIDTAREYLRGSAGLPSSYGWSGPDPNAWREQVGPTSTTGAGKWNMSGMFSDFGENKGTTTIDSREAVKKYGGKFMW